MIQKWKGMSEMRKTKKISGLFVLCMMVVVISICSMSSLVAAAPQDAKELVAQAYQRQLSLKNYHMTLDSTTTICSGEACQYGP